MFIRILCSLIKKLDATLTMGRGRNHSPRYCAVFPGDGERRGVGDDWGEGMVGTEEDGTEKQGFEGVKTGPRLGFQRVVVGASRLPPKRICLAFCSVD